MLLEVHAFGKLHMRHRLAVVDTFPTQAVEELLAYLLLSPKRRHTREELVALLWPDKTLTKARHSLSMVLWRLRRSFQQIDLPAELYLQSTRDWVSFWPERPYQFDRDLFEASYRQAKTASDAAEKEALLRQAHDLYRGDLLQGIYADWCLVERRRLADLRLNLLHDLMACCMQRQAYDEAIQFGQTLIQEDPLWEEIHRDLMRCYATRGQYTQAARQYHLYVDLLWQELQCPPLPETTYVYAQILETRFNNAIGKPLAPEVLRSGLLQAYQAFQQAGKHLNDLLDEIDSPPSK